MMCGGDMIAAWQQSTWSARDAIEALPFLAI
jgi:hypothetical protein